MDVLLSNGGFKVKEWWSDKHLDTTRREIVRSPSGRKGTWSIVESKEWLFTHRVKLSEKVISTNQEEDNDAVIGIFVL